MQYVPSTQSSICREEHGEMLRKVEGWLKLGGEVVLNLSPKAGKGSVEEWLGSRMFSSRFGIED